MVLAFFAASDGIVMENLVSNFMGSTHRFFPPRLDFEAPGGMVPRYQKLRKAVLSVRIDPKLHVGSVDVFLG